jgi:hypothetical protein
MSVGLTARDSCRSRACTRYAQGGGPTDEPGARRLDLGLEPVTLSWTVAILGFVGCLAVSQGRPADAMP